MVGTVVRSLLRLWALALMLSAGLAAAGERWPEPLAPRPLVVLALVLGLPVAVLVWLAANWRLPPPIGSGAGEGGESQQSELSEF
jgi:hypothetical protein